MKNKDRPGDINPLHFSKHIALTVGWNDGLLNRYARTAGSSMMPVTYRRLIFVFDMKIDAGNSVLKTDLPLLTLYQVLTMSGVDN
jgi:hypothetical protein